MQCKVAKVAFKNHVWNMLIEVSGKAGSVVAGFPDFFPFFGSFSVTPYCLLGQLQFLGFQFQFSRLG